MFRPTHKPTVLPTSTPFPTSTYQPTVLPSFTNQPTPKPIPFPTIPEAQSGIAKLVDAIFIPSCLAIVGISMGMYIFKRDAKRAKHWNQIMELHNKSVEDIRTMLREHDEPEDLIEDYILKGFPDPEEPEYTSIPAQVMCFLDKVGRWITDKFWLFFCEVRLVRDPSSYRLIDEVLRMNSTPRDDGHVNISRIQHKKTREMSEELVPQQDLIRTSSKASMKTLPKKVRSSFEQAQRRSLDNSGGYHVRNNNGNGSADEGAKSPQHASGVETFGSLHGRSMKTMVPPSDALTHIASPGHTRAVKVRPGRWSAGGSPTANLESPHLGFQYQNHLIDGFEPDCGPDQRILILSYAKAQFERLKRTPHKKYQLKNHKWTEENEMVTLPSEKWSKVLPTIDGDYVSLFPLTENFGQHSVHETVCEKLWPKHKPIVNTLLHSAWFPMLRCRDEDAHPLLAYPIGIRLYFKMMKAVYRVFFWFSLVSCLSMYILWQSSAWDQEQKKSFVFGISSSTREDEVGLIDKLYYGLFFTTLGSLGERSLQCRSFDFAQDQVEDENMFSLTCPSGHINFIHAYYGNPLGSCTCPVSQQVNQQGQCKAKLQFSDQASPTSSDIHDDYDEGSGNRHGSCSAGGAGCIKSETIFGEPCCAHRLLSRPVVQPDLTDLLPRDNPTCFSETAQYIIQNQCIGKQQCNLTIDSNITYQYYPKELRQNIKGDQETRWMLPCSKSDLNISTSHQCEETLMRGGNWSSCSGFQKKKLTVVAECRNMRVSWPMLSSFIPQHHSISTFEVGSVLSYIDAILMILILMFLFWLEQKEDEEVRMATKNVCTGGDYTAFTAFLPPHHDVAKLKRQLAKFLEKELSKATPVFRDGPVEVCDINFGFNGLNLRIFKKRGLLARKLDLLEEKIFLMNKQHGVVGRCFQKQRMILLDEEVRCLRAQFKDICQEARNRKGLVVAKCAFVTFFDQEGKERCLKTFPQKFHGYSFLSSWLNLFWTFSTIPLFEIKDDSSISANGQNTDRKRNNGCLRIRSGETSNNQVLKTRFEFVQAPAPEDILWENLTTPNSVRFFKKLFTHLLIFMLMTVSFAFVFSVSSYRNQNSERSEESSESSACSDLRFLFNETGFDVQLLGRVGTEIITKHDVMRDKYPHYFNLTGSPIDDDDALGDDVGGSMLGCYCEAVDSAGGIKLRDAVLMQHPVSGRWKHYCKLYFDRKLKAEALRLIAIAAATTTITGVNLGLKYVYIYLIDFEGPASRTEKVLSLTRKLTFAMFVNTACLTLILNGNLSWFTHGASKFDKFLLNVNVFIGKNNDFGAQWYFNVGTALVITMMINLVAINFYKYGEWISYQLFIFLDHANCDKTCGKGNRDNESSSSSSSPLHRITNKTTQFQLEELVAGPMFVIYDRYAGLVNTFFVCIIYSPGIPILIPILFATYFITYLVDKHTLLRIYKLPSALDSSVAITTTKSLKYAVFIHLLIAMWMYSNNDIFETKEQYQQEFIEFSDRFLLKQSLSVFSTNSSSTTMDDDHWLASHPWVKSTGVLAVPLFNRFWRMLEYIDAYFFCWLLIICIGLFMKIAPLLTYWFPWLSRLGFELKRYEVRKVANDIMKRASARKVKRSSVANEKRETKQTKEKEEEVKSEGGAQSTHRLDVSSLRIYTNDSSYRRMDEMSPDDDVIASETLRDPHPAHASPHGEKGRKWFQKFGQRHVQQTPSIDALADVSWHNDQCAHSKLRNHKLYGHSGEGIGEGNPDYFHAISRAELEGQIAARIIRGNVLKSYQSELEWRNKNPRRAVAAKQIIGLCSYNYQLDSEYKKLYALDSKSYYRFQAGKLDVTDADYLLRRRGIVRRVLGYFLDLSLLNKTQDPTAIFPDPPSFEEEKEDIPIIGVHPKCIIGPRIILNLKVPNAEIHALAAHHDNEKLLDGIEKSISLQLNVPGVGPMNVCLPSGVLRLGVPELQIEIPCVESPNSNMDKGGKIDNTNEERSCQTFWICINHGLLSICYLFSCAVLCCWSCLKSLVRCCFCESTELRQFEWEQELECVADDIQWKANGSTPYLDQVNPNEKKQNSSYFDLFRWSQNDKTSAGASILEMITSSPLHEQQTTVEEKIVPEFSRTMLDDVLDLEMELLEQGPPQLQTFVAKAPKEVVLQNMIPVMVEDCSKVWCRWPRTAREHDEIKFQLPVISKQFFKDGNHFGFMNVVSSDESTDVKSYDASLFSPGWCLVAFPNSERVTNGASEAKDDGGVAIPKRLFGLHDDGVTGGAWQDDHVNPHQHPHHPYDDISALFQMVAYARKPLIKNFRDLSQVPFKVPGSNIGIIALHPSTSARQQRQKNKFIRVNVPTSRDRPLDRQQTRVDIPGVGCGIPVEILASDVVVVPGLHGRPVHAHGFLPWQSWWDDDPLVTQQAVPLVDEVFFEYPCIEPIDKDDNELFSFHKTNTKSMGKLDKINKISQKHSNLFHSECEEKEHSSQLHQNKFLERKNAAIWAAEEHSVSYAAGSPIFLEQMQIVASKDMVRCSREHKFQFVKEVESLGDVSILLPSNSRVKNTKLNFELPTVKALKTNRVAKADNIWASLVSASVEEEQGCATCLCSKPSEHPALNHQLSSSSSSRRTKRPSSKKEGLGQALKKLQEEHEALLSGSRDSFREKDCLSSFSSIFDCCCCSGSSNDDAASTNDKVDGIIESSIIDDVGHEPLQIGWVILPLSLTSSPQAYLMLPAMVEYKQVLKAMVRSHGLLNPKFDTPPNEPSLQTPIKYTTTPTVQPTSSNAPQADFSSSTASSTSEGSNSFSTMPSSDDGLNDDPAFAISDLDIFSIPLKQTSEPLKQDNTENHHHDSSTPNNASPFIVHECYLNRPDDEYIWEEHLCIVKQKSQLGLEFDRDVSGFLVVKSVLPHSGGERGNLSVDDRIVSINSNEEDFSNPALPVLEVKSILQHLLTGECQAQITVPPFAQSSQIKKGMILTVSVPLLDSSKATHHNKIKNRNVKVKVPVSAKAGDTLEFTVSNVDPCFDLEIVIERKTKRIKDKKTPPQNLSFVRLFDHNQNDTDANRQNKGKETSPNNVKNVNKLSTPTYDDLRPQKGVGEEDGETVLTNPLMFGSPRHNPSSSPPRNESALMRHAHLMDCKYIVFDEVCPVNIGLKLGRKDDHNLVLHVFENSLAQRQGLVVGDRITQLNGSPVHNSLTSSSFASSFSSSSSSLSSLSMNSSHLDKQCLGYKLAKMLRANVKVILQVMHEQPPLKSFTSCAQEEVVSDYNIMQHLNSIAMIKVDNSATSTKQLSNQSEPHDYDKQADNVVNLVLPSLLGGINIAGVGVCTDIDAGKDTAVEINLLQVEKFTEYQSILIWKAQNNNSNFSMSAKRKGSGRSKNSKKRKNRFFNKGLKNGEASFFCLCCLEEVRSAVVQQRPKKRSHHRGASIIPEKSLEVPCSNEFTLVFSRLPAHDITEITCCRASSPSSSTQNSFSAFSPLSKFELNLVCETVEQCSLLIRCFTILSYRALRNKIIAGTEHSDREFFASNKFSLNSYDLNGLLPKNVASENESKDYGMQQKHTSDAECSLETNALSHDDSQPDILDDVTSSPSTINTDSSSSISYPKTTAFNTMMTAERITEIELEKQLSMKAMQEADSLSALFERTKQTNQLSFSSGDMKLKEQSSLHHTQKGRDISPMTKALELTSQFQAAYADKQETAIAVTNENEPISIDHNGDQQKDSESLLASHTERYDDENGNSKHKQASNNESNNENTNPILLHNHEIVEVAINKRLDRIEAHLTSATSPPHHLTAAKKSGLQCKKKKNAPLTNRSTQLRANAIAKKYQK